MSSPKIYDLLPINPKHPFWSLDTGSKMNLVLIKPPSSHINSLVVTVNTISRPYIYELMIYQDGFSPRVVYHKKKDAIKVIKNDWWIYYGDRTQVEIIETEIVNMSGLAPLSNSSGSNSSRNSSRNSSTNNSKDVSPRSPIVSPGRLSGVIDSCPPTPSPRTLRKSSLRERISMAVITKKNSPRNSPRNSPKNSPRNSWRNSKNGSNGNSANSSPRPDSPISNANNSNNSDSDEIINTTQLLKRVSVKLGSPTIKRNDDPALYPHTPRNSMTATELLI